MVDRQTASYSGHSEVQALHEFAEDAQRAAGRGFHRSVRTGVTDRLQQILTVAYEGADPVPHLPVAPTLWITPPTREPALSVKRGCTGRGQEA